MPDTKIEITAAMVEAALDAWSAGDDDWRLFGEVTEDWRRDMRIALTAALALVTPNSGFQARVQPWMMACFGAEIAADKLERLDRLLEEVLELCQAQEYPEWRIDAIKRYTFDRPQGDVSQELGGVMVTLAALCLANDLDMHTAGETELARVSTPEMIAKIRAKQAAKPKFSPLPVAAPSMDAGFRAGAEWVAGIAASYHEDLAAQHDALKGTSHAEWAKQHRRDAQAIRTALVALPEGSL